MCHLGKEMDNLTSSELPPDALLALVGSGKELWADEHADAYVYRLRESWD